MNGQPPSSNQPQAQAQTQPQAQPQSANTPGPGFWDDPNPNADMVFSSLTRKPDSFLENYNSPGLPPLVPIICSQFLNTTTFLEINFCKALAFIVGWKYTGTFECK